jgi:hypothetical protein
MREIVLYVPGDPRHCTVDAITPGSAIVARPEPGGDTVEVYFEGNTRGASNIRTYADRAYHASDRMLQSYPTSAKGTVPRDALVVVGTFHVARRRIILTGPTSERAVADWIGKGQLDPAELEVSRRA